MKLNKKNDNILLTTKEKGVMKMFIFDLTNVLTLILVLIATVLFIFLSQETKKSMISVIPLFAFLIDLVIHTIQMLTLKSEFSYLYSKLCMNMAIDFVFLLVTFLAYLWADDVEAKELNKKTINSKGIDWLFKNV